MSNVSESTTVGEIVAADFRAASLFEQFGIDFCCGGRQTVADACRTAAVDPAVIERALEALSTDTADADGDVTRWPVDRLIDHIVETHHDYVRSALPTIGRYLTKLVQVHGRRHPELTRVAASFEHVAGDMLQHMDKEEAVLFPYIRTRASQPRGAAQLPSPFGTIENPIGAMEREHQQTADEMRLIRELTQDYVPPADGCTTYRVTLQELARFERDLHRHVHLENNVLFPRAVETERASSRG
jgi:regulator of cell morphogenesis and NO signaling